MVFKQSFLARTPEARLNKLFELAQAVAGEGEVSWTQFDRSKSIHRFGLTPDQLSSWKALFQVQAGSLQGEAVRIAYKEQVVSIADQGQVESIADQGEAVSVADKAQEAEVTPNTSLDTGSIPKAETENR